MSMLRPDARALRILSDVKTGEPPPDHPIEAGLYHLHLPDPDREPAEDVAVAWDLYQNTEHHVVDALLLVGASDALVGEGLGISAGVLAAYRHLFFDPKVFKHAFAVRRYAYSVPPDGSEEHKSYQFALIEGAESLLNRYRVGEIPIADPAEVTKRVMTDMAARAREARGRPLTSKVAQEAIRAGKAAVESAVALKTLQPKTNDATAAQRLEIALTSQDGIFTPQAANVVLKDIVRDGPTPDTPKPEGD